MAVPTKLKRLFLRGIKWDAEQGDITLLAAIEAVCKARLDEIREGRVISQTGGSGATVSFTFPSGVAPTDIASLASDMLDLYESIKADAPDATDDEMFVAMMARLKPITNFRPDFSTYRL